MSRGYIGKESDGSGRGNYTPPIPLLVKRRGYHTSDMNDPLEVKVCEELPPINRLRNPSYEFFRRLRMHIRLYGQTIEGGTTEFMRRTEGQLDSAFERVRSTMKKRYEESFFNVLETIYKRLSKSREGQPSPEIVDIIKRI